MTAPKGTDWDAYYRRPYRAASLTRQITSGALRRAMRDFAPATGTRGLRVGELGGANSCFYESIQREFAPREYHVVDTNRLGLELLRERVAGNGGLLCHEADVLEFEANLDCDVVFSVGLIEHFAPGDTARAVATHFRMTRPGGVVIITFPTPTWLYRGARFVSEALGQWIFHDERPLEMEEVHRAVAGRGMLVRSRIIWPIVLTQGLVVVATPEAAGRAENG